MKRKNKLIAWLAGGIILALGPVWGMLGTVVGMVLAFGHFGQAELQAEVVANDISLALYTTAAGFIVCPFGIAIIIIAAIRLSKAKRTAEEFPTRKWTLSTESALSVERSLPRWTMENMRKRLTLVSAASASIVLVAILSSRYIARLRADRLFDFTLQSGALYYDSTVFSLVRFPNITYPCWVVCYDGPGVDLALPSVEISLFGKVLGTNPLNLIEKMNEYESLTKEEPNT
jgi:hypothetical protein